MLKLYDKGVYLMDGTEMIEDSPENAMRLQGVDRAAARHGSIAWRILEAHNQSNAVDDLKIKFDALTSHDITYVGVIQTAKACGMDRFPIPYVLTNCHNSLCAVGGTINEDDHLFGLSAAERYGGIYVPQHLAVIHAYMREMFAGCGKMILGSDSHTRYGALGTLAIGEGGGELVKQLLGQTYDIPRPPIVGIYLKGRPTPGVGPQDVALTLVRAVFENGYVKNCIVEFVGEGVSNLSMDYRCGIDVMTTETTCLSSIWRTDAQTEAYLAIHDRPNAYVPLEPEPVAYYDRMIVLDLSKVRPMIALPFHPSNAYEIQVLNDNLFDILHEEDRRIQDQFGNVGKQLCLSHKIQAGKLRVDQGIIAGCSGGTFENLMRVTEILAEKTVGNGAFSLAIYPQSQPVMLELSRNGAMVQLMQSGVIIRTAFCGPCFGAGDVPANGGLSVRHTTRNFPNREGSKPTAGQLSGVALMDARSIAATARNGGILTPATDLDIQEHDLTYAFDCAPYRGRVYNGYGRPHRECPLIYGPNIVDWPEISSMPEHLLLRLCSVIHDPVTTTDELIPSGETSSYRSNPLGLAEFTLSRKDPGYVVRAKAVVKGLDDAAYKALDLLKARNVVQAQSDNAGFGSVIYANRPGDGSAREQAASCQRVLGGCANIALAYATKRYRSNCINWGLLPFRIDHEPDWLIGQHIFLPDIRAHLLAGDHVIPAWIVGTEAVEIELLLDDLTEKERDILLAGCLINYNRETHKEAVSWP